MVFELENKAKILADKNKTLFSEVVNMRRDADQKENELEKA